MAKSNILSALQFLRTDLDTANKQWREGSQFESLLQREGVDLQALLDKFDPIVDENLWAETYGTDRDLHKLRLYKRRMAFLQASRKEFHEEYDPDVTDVDFMRLLELPYTDPKYVIEYSIDELKDP